MKSLKIRLISWAACSFLIVTHWSFSAAKNHGRNSEESSLELSDDQKTRALTPEEEALANEARAHIAKTIENNLIRLLAVLSARNRNSRQEEDEDENATPTPNIIAPVAQILEAIFSGNLNITRIVDRTHGLVPDALRNQVDGIVKLLTGESIDPTPSTTKAPAKASVLAATALLPPIIVPATINDAVTIQPETEPSLTEQIAESVLDTIQQVNQNNTGRYKIRNRPRPVTEAPLPTPTIFEEDAIIKLEEELRKSAELYGSQPHTKRDPKGIAEDFQKIFGGQDLNSTDVTSNVPNLFQGAMQWYDVLNRLGLMEPIKAFIEYEIDFLGLNENE